MNRVEYTKQQLVAWGFDHHGIGLIDGYGENGYAGTWSIRSEADVLRLSANLIYTWRS